MGCLFQLIFEILIEGVLSIVVPIYLKLTSLFLQGKTDSDLVQKKIKDVVTTVSLLLLVSAFVGALLLLPEDVRLNMIGRYMTFIPLCIIGAQIALGVVVIIIKAVKRQH